MGGSTKKNIEISAPVRKAQDVSFNEVLIPITVEQIDRTGGKQYMDIYNIYMLYL